MSRRTPVVMAAVVAGVLAATILVSPATAFTRRTARLTGVKEIPGPGDSNGSGRASIRVFPAQRKLCFYVRWDDIRNPLAAHLHRGRADVAGPVKVPLFEGVVREQDYKQGCIKDVPRALLRRMRQNPHWFYVNVHNKPYSDGAIRGQLRRPA